MADTVIFEALRVIAPHERIARLIADAEASLGLSITIHDRAALFRCPDGQSLIHHSWQAHRHSYCAFSRRVRPGWDRQCVHHCQDGVNAHAATVDGPFTHRCWKGATEVVVPVRLGGVHVATLFAGSWREAVVPPGDLGPGAVARHGRLPLASAGVLDRAAGALLALGDALLAEVERVRRLSTAGDDRVARITAFLQVHAHRPVGIADLAQVLGLSTSRASHVVVEAMGQPFRSVLLAERLRRAREMLRDSAASVRVISEQVGFGSPYYFNRVFARAEGMPPGRYRKTHRGKDHASVARS